MNNDLFDLTPYNTIKEQQPVSGRKRLRRAQRHQIEYKIGSIDDLIPLEHRARDVWDYVSQMNLSCFHEDIRVTESSRGPGTLDPAVAMSLWLFAALNGVISAREITRLCKEHYAYIWICGGVSINHHTLSDFKALNSDKFNKLLIESIAIMWKSGSFNPEEVAQDGTRIKANAGRCSLKREATLEEYLTIADIFIERLKKDLKKNPLELRQKAAKERVLRERKERIEKAMVEMATYKKARTEECKKNNKYLSNEDKEKIRISTTDPDCRKMKMGMGGFRPAFNAQFATTTDGKVIVGVDLVNTQDPGTLVPMMKQVHENLEQIKCPKPKRWLTDAAYANKSDINLAAEHFPDIDIYAPPQGNQFVDGLTPRKNDSAAMSALRERMGTDLGKEIYKKRCSTAEFANAVVKNRGLTEFLTRGLMKAKNSVLIYAVMHNMMRYWAISSIS